MTHTPLTPREQQMLDFAGHWWRTAGAAAEHAPTTIARLRRLRTARR